MKPEIQAAYITAIPAGIFAFAAVWVAFNQQRLEKKKAQRELFEKFNTRFNNLNQVLNSIEPNADELTHEQQVAVSDYLNLCSEEYLWYKKKLIDEEVWLSWLSGIRFYLRVPLVNSYFASERANDSSYYGFISHLNEK